MEGREGRETDGLHAIGASSVLNEQEGKGKVEEEREGKQGKEGLRETLKLCFSGCTNRTDMGQAASGESSIHPVEKTQVPVLRPQSLPESRGCVFKHLNHLLGSVLPSYGSVFFCRARCLALLSKRVSGKTKGRKEGEDEADTVREKECSSPLGCCKQPMKEAQAKRKEGGWEEHLHGENKYQGSQYPE